LYTGLPGPPLLSSTVSQSISFANFPFQIQLERSMMQKL
jgi:hypothetical protein